MLISILFAYSLLHKKCNGSLSFLFRFPQILCDIMHQLQVAPIIQGACLRCLHHSLPASVASEQRLRIGPSFAGNVQFLEVFKAAVLEVPSVCVLQDGSLPVCLFQVTHLKLCLWAIQKIVNALHFHK